jgi:hypothetical protein
MEEVGLGKVDFVSLAGLVSTACRLPLLVRIGCVSYLSFLIDHPA